MEEACSAALANEEAVASLRLLSRTGQSVSLSSLQYLPSIRAALERECVDCADTPKLLRLCAARHLTACGRVLLPPPTEPLLARTDWPAQLRAVLLPASGAAAEEVLLSFADCALVPLAATLRVDAGDLFLGRPLGARPKAGRPRGEPRLYWAASGGLRKNVRASWLSGAGVYGDAVLAHVSPPPRRWSPAERTEALPGLNAADVSLAAYEQLAAASLPLALLARVGGDSETAPKRALAELCSRLAGPPARVEAEAAMQPAAEAEPVFAQPRGEPPAWLTEALAQLAALDWPPSVAHVAGWRAVAHPPAALSANLMPCAAAASARAAAEHGAARALLADMQALAECALRGSQAPSPAAASPPPPPPPRLFSPPLAEQRRAFVACLLRCAGAESLLDAGCGQGALLASLASRRFGVGPPRRLAGCDVSSAALAEARAALGGDVDVELRQVSVLDCSADWPTMAFDAVACVEVLEHLPSEAHAARAGAALLRLARRLAVFTTPRSEANAAMRAAAGGGWAAAGASTFRDADHKFEWSGAELEAWAHGAAAEAGGRWSICFVDLGAMRSQVQPEGVARIGASQAAIFSRLE